MRRWKARAQSRQRHRWTESLFTSALERFCLWGRSYSGPRRSLRIYRGADGDFTLYEDENDNYDYEKGAYATIPFRWDDARKVLTIGNRQGEFPGMLAERTFQIVFVKENHGSGIEAAAPDRVVRYSGKQITVSPTD
jgi:alpha-D-xyloside xylohydrolase